MKILFTIAILSTIAGTISASNLSAGAESQAQNPDSPKQGAALVSSKPFFKDLVLVTEGYGQRSIDLDKLLSAFPEFRIPGRDEKSSKTIPETDYEGFKTYVAIEPKSQLNAAILVDPALTPEVKERKKGAYKIWQGLDSSKAAKIFQTEDGPDYIVVYLEYLFKLPFDLTVYFDGSPADTLLSSPQFIRQGFQLLRWLHSQGYAAINFNILRKSQEKSSTQLLLDNLQFLTPLNQPVGKMPFDSLQTDPVALTGEGSFLADEALDWFVFGIELLRGFLKDSRVGDSLRANLPSMKKSMAFELPSESPVSLALLACYLLQDDRKARANLEVLELLVNLVSEDTQRARLGKVLTYHSKDNPLLIPEFANIAATLGVRSEGSFGIPSWAVVSGAAVGVLGLVAILFVCCRKETGQEEAAADAHRNLHEETKPEPDIVLKNNDHWFRGSE